MSVKLTFVLPWYGADVAGGAETEARKTIAALHRLAGLDVEVWTTCAQDFQSDWSVNARPAGSAWVDDIPVQRFPVRPRDTHAFDAVNLRLMHRLPVSAAEEATYMREMIHSPALYAWIQQHGAQRVLVFIPYMFGTTYAGAAIYPERSVLIPCLHDEPYAYMSCYRDLFRRVRGVALHTKAEMALAQRLYTMQAGAPALVGEGIDTDVTFEAARFQARYGYKDFLLYVGRKEPGKNVPLLVEYFTHYKRHYGGSLQLILLGKGDVAIPADRRHDIVDLGFLPEQDKLDAYAAALALCQPSLHESFSIVMMEAWLAGTPVLVHADCAVTREHCQEAHGGLWFADAAEFAAAVHCLAHDPRLCRVLGAQGRRYVLRSFTWETVVQRYVQVLAHWGLSPDVPQRPAVRVPPPQPPPVRAVHQILAGFRQGDAISQIALALQHTLRAWGFASDIFAQHVHPTSRDLGYTLEQFAQYSASEQVVLYHYSIHSEASAAFLQYSGTKILLYHNITPAHFFAGYSDLHVSLMELGRAHLPDLIQAADLCLGVSRYNCLELERYGAHDCRVLPPLLDLERLGRVCPDPQVMQDGLAGPPSILFVGRPVPNKQQERIIQAFATYRQRYNADARLVLVGGSDEADRYTAELQTLGRALGLEQQIRFTGHVNEAQLVAYYRTARAFLSMSAHEGFGVPLLEAMYFHVPVVAYAATAVPYTLGTAGLLLHEPSSTVAAAALHQVMVDGEVRTQVLARQHRRLQDFAPTKVQAMLRLYLDELLATRKPLP